MNKLALMQSLKLSDVIHLLGNDINNPWIRSAAAIIQTDSVDQFLDEMHHLITFCGDYLQRNPLTSKYEKTKDSTPKFNKIKDVISGILQNKISSAFITVSQATHTKNASS